MSYSLFNVACPALSPLYRSGTLFLNIFKKRNEDYCKLFFLAAFLISMAACEPHREKIHRGTGKSPDANMVPEGTTTEPKPVEKSKLAEKEYSDSTDYSPDSTAQEQGREQNKRRDDVRKTK